MAEKRYITASEIGLYTFCPRAWALKQLDCESDAHWEMEKGKEFHENGCLLFEGDIKDGNKTGKGKIYDEW